MKTNAPRLVSPIGFLLATLLFLFLPFVAVSCEVPGVGEAELSYSGVDVVGGADPSVTATGRFGQEAADPVTDDENPPTPGTGGQVLAIITLVLLAGGLVVSLIPLARTRLMVTAGAALLGAIGLITTQAVAQSNLSSAILDAARQESASRPSDNTPFNLTSGIIDDMVQTRFGFWLSLIAVLLVLVYSGGALLLPRIRAATAQSTPSPAEQNAEERPPPPQ